MELTTHQKQQLSADLRHTANIEYDEVYNELYDHYATLVENDLASEQSFEVARERAWHELGHEWGLKKIEGDFLRNVHSQIRQQHWGILKSYFRWPMFVVTALIGVLVYLVIPMLSGEGITIALFAAAGVGNIYIFWKIPWNISEQKNVPAILWTYLHRATFIPCTVTNLTINLGRLFFEGGGEEMRGVLQANTGICAGIIFLLTIYTLASYRLFHVIQLAKPVLQS